MIISDKSGVELNGTLIELLDDLTEIISGVHELLSERISKEFADTMIMMSGKFALMNDSDAKELKKRIKEGLK